jgi:hypothetical protein
MSKLSSKQRSKLPSKDFAVKGGKYPISDINHARAGLSMVAKYGSPAEQAAVHKKVAAKYPGIK